MGPLRPRMWERVRDVISALGMEPPAAGTVKLRGIEGAYRIRVGDYRIVYEVDDPERSVIIRRVRHRREAHQDLQRSGTVSVR